MLPDRRTVIIGLLSYTAWGLFPIYWQYGDGIATGEMLAHRFLWSLGFYLAVWLMFRARRAEVAGPSLRDWILSGVGGAVLGLNWLIFIFAVTNHRVLEASLAYFLNPLLNVAVGAFIFKEPIPWGMRIAVALAGLGIGTQLLGQAEFPWISLGLAGTFCTYGIVKKVMKVESNFGLVMESSVMFLPALVAAVVLRQQSPVETLQPHHWAFLVGTGIVTGIPLLLFAYAAQRLPYSLLGVMQFVAPTLQFLVGWLMYDETPTTSRLICFGLVWAGVAFYLGDRLARLRRTIEVEERIEAEQAKA